MDRRLSPMGAREIAVAGQVDRDKLRRALHKLGDACIFNMLYDAIELIPPAGLGKLYFTAWTTNNVRAAHALLAVDLEFSGPTASVTARVTPRALDLLSPAAPS
jgi:hypothetical protein